MVTISREPALAATGDQQLGAGRNEEAQAGYERALEFARANKLEAGNGETLARIRESIKVARVKSLLSKAGDSFRHSRWSEAINDYAAAFKLHQDSKLQQEFPGYDQALANLAAARRAAALEYLRQGEAEAQRYFAAEEWNKAKIAYGKLLTLVAQSGYGQDRDFAQIHETAKSRLGEVEERLLVTAKKEYLAARHRAILRKVFNLGEQVAFLDPEVVYLTEDENGMKYSITARTYERKGSEGKYTIYEVIYAFSRKNDDWVLVDKKMSSQVSAGR